MVEGEVRREKGRLRGWEKGRLGGRGRGEVRREGEKGG